MSDNFYLMRTQYDDKYCVIDKLPSGIQKEFRIKNGQEMGSLFPEGASMTMSKDYPGMAVPDAIFNTVDFLMVSEPLKDLVEELRRGKTEFLPFTLTNHKRKAVDGRFFVINPIGTVPCVDRDRTDGRVSAIKPDQYRVLRKLFIDEARVPEGEHLFRIDAATEMMVVSREFRDRVRGAGFKGLRFVEMGKRI